jgi:anthranilate synthase
MAKNIDTENLAISKTLTTDGGIQITQRIDDLGPTARLREVLSKIDTHPGALFASGYEYPGRYSRWDIGFVNPPLELVARARDFRLTALNSRGKVLVALIRPALEGHEHLESLEGDENELRGRVREMPDFFPEEQRSQQPSIFSVLRALTKLFGTQEDKHLGLYGAFGYDLVFQFEPIKLRHSRETAPPDLHLFLPDELVIIDHRKEQAYRLLYDFEQNGNSTAGMERTGKKREIARSESTGVTSDHEEGEYAKKVTEIVEGTRRGDFFEVVLSQVLSSGYPGAPSDLFEAIRQTNPSPYEFLINLGDEQLVGASPEMYVRVDGQQVETCPISGTIPRGASPIEDAEQIQRLLNSKKDEAELTMCTDVDRNDKSRVCKPGSVRVEGRKLIETYSHLFHTVDHVRGELADHCDAMDAFLSHMWACTLTGSPKPTAMQRVENMENSARGWYGGAVGMLLFNGNINTGITIRTVYLSGGTARVRAGATLMCESNPEEEERETRTKAAAFINAVLGKTKPAHGKARSLARTGEGKRILFVDNADSFVHTLANYVRQTGAEVVTVRAGFPERILDEMKPDLVFISPGPGRPSDFKVPELVLTCVERGLPIFGVCLGLQGIVEAFGGELGVLPQPVHGRSSRVRCQPKGLLEGFPEEFDAARYHSLYARIDRLPDCLRVLAQTEDGTIMAIEHKSYPLAAVQFHPESILTLKDDLGVRLISRVVDRIAGASAPQRK